jgi:hypothetical protein
MQHLSVMRRRWLAISGYARAAVSGSRRGATLPSHASDQRQQRAISGNGERSAATASDQPWWIH